MGGGECGQEGGGWGGVDGNREGETGRGSLEGGNGEGEMGRGSTGTGREWQWGGEMERGVMGGGRWEGGNGEEERGKRWGWGGGEEGARGGEITQMDMMRRLGGHRL